MNDGSWPLQNLEMANSLKRQGYDFHLSFGTGTHNGAHGNSEAPLELTWLWRDYDPAKTEQVYQMEPEEAARGMFRVKILTAERCRPLRRLCGDKVDFDFHARLGELCLYRRPGRLRGAENLRVDFVHGRKVPAARKKH